MIIMRAEQGVLSFLVKYNAAHFEKINCLLQEQAIRIYVVRDLMNQLLEALLTRFVCRDALKGTD